MRERWESYRPCSWCGGAGTFGGDPCPECFGEGEVDVEEIDTGEWQYRHEDWT